MLLCGMLLSPRFIVCILDFLYDFEMLAALMVALGMERPQTNK